jgi:hypothetical protein
VELAVAVVPSLAQIETATIFVPTGSMNEARYLHAAALLESGEVLVTGGVNQGGSGGSMTRYRASAELYDVPQKAFKLTDSMSIRRAFHTATTLPDGTVLIAGGISIKCMTCDGTVVAAAERYDPSRKKFFPTGSLIAARAFHTATLLADGRVLIAGGRDLNNFSLSSAELFDPATGTFSPAGPMFSSHAGHTATLLQDGRVLIVGGFNPAEIYDPMYNLFAPTGSLSHPRGGHTATLLQDGRVLIAGGSNFGPAIIEIPQAELYDPTSGIFSPTGDLIVPRGNHRATLLANGQVLLVGGTTASNILASVELYEPATGAFSLAGNMTMPRAAHVQIQLDSGDVLVAGGVDGSNMITSTAELYQP